MIKAFTLGKTGARIRGLAYFPEHCGEALPAVIISHEFGLNMLSAARYALSVCRLGYAVFIFDFRGSGSGISSGRSADMSVLTEKDDLSQVLDYVRSLSNIDASRITLMGCSQGGMVSAMLAAERESEIAGLILCYPALCIPDDARRGSVLGTEFSPDAPPQSFRALYVKLGRRYIEDVLRLEPWREICSFSKPVLIVHGTSDGIVPFRYAELAHGRYPDSRLIKLEGARHLFPIRGAKKAKKEIAAFLAEKHL